MISSSWGLQGENVKQRNELGIIPVQLGTSTGSADAVSEDIIFDGSLNYELLSQYVFVLDLKKQKIWMK